MLRNIDGSIYDPNSLITGAEIARGNTCLNSSRDSLMSESAGVTGKENFAEISPRYPAFSDEKLDEIEKEFNEEFRG